jgi:hypothetical protein
MNEQPSDSLEMGLAFEDHLPLAWTVLGAPPDPQQLVKMQLANQETLYVILCLEEYPAEWVEDPPTNPQELGRIDFKINLLLDLVGCLLAQHISLPSPVRIKLTPQEIRWEAVTAPALGSLVQVDAYLNLRYPRPVTLIGPVSDVQPLAQGFLVTVRLDGLSESLQQAIEKLIFRHHRRLIAYTRRQSTRHAS